MEPLHSYYTTFVLDGQVPQWKDAPDGGEYNPSTNIPPTAYTPILVTGDKVS